MSSKRRNSSKPLEWAFQYVNSTDATVTNDSFDLDLKDDEVAEIWAIDSSIAIGNVPDAANDDIDVGLMLSMDPDIAVTPLTAANQQDLEVFFMHRYEVQQEIGAAGSVSLVNSDHKSMNFNPPILVGTNVGMVVVGDATIACEFWARLYFTRRKANVLELNQVLLKRR
jgi:hypothetical protein